MFVMSMLFFLYKLNSVSHLPRCVANSGALCCISPGKLLFFSCIFLIEANLIFVSDKFSISSPSLDLCFIWSKLRHKSCLCIALALKYHLWCSLGGCKSVHRSIANVFLCLRNNSETN